jgi:D-arabinose 1-dehydrogenase-like Zn-dependent alcohol dehydrogenase
MPYHALNESSLKVNEYLLIFGASGNTRMISVQLGKRRGVRVIAVSRDSWIKDKFGADYIIATCLSIIPLSSSSFSLFANVLLLKPFNVFLNFKYLTGVLVQHNGMGISK